MTQKLEKKKTNKNVKKSSGTAVFSLDDIAIIVEQTYARNDAQRPLLYSVVHFVGSVVKLVSTVVFQVGVCLTKNQIRCLLTRRKVSPHRVKHCIQSEMTFFIELYLSVKERERIQWLTCQSFSAMIFQFQAPCSLRGITYHSKITYPYH